MKRIELLDYSRFFAALCVISFHYLFNGIHNGKIASITHIPELVKFAKYGYLGVEFFFMISGYVIFFSAKNRSAKEFAISRAVRLFPAFWMAVIFTSTVAYFWGVSQTSVSILQAIVNLTMIPNLFGYDFVDGVYWTLQVELSFYGLVLIVLMLGLQKKLEFLFLLWPFVMLMALLLSKSNFPFMGKYYSYFAAGAIFAIQKNQLTKISIVSLLISLGLCIAFSAGKAGDLSLSRGVHYSPLIISAIIGGQFLFFVLLNSTVGINLRLPGSKLVGNLTYPIYLIHAHFGYMFISKFATEENKLVIYAVTIIVVLICSYFIYNFIERRLSRFWQSLFFYSIGKPFEVISNFRQRHTASYTG